MFNCIECFTESQIKNVAQIDNFNYRFFFTKPLLYYNYRTAISSVLKSKPRRFVVKMGKNTNHFVIYN